MQQFKFISWATFPILSYHALCMKEVKNLCKEILWQKLLLHLRFLLSFLNMKTHVLDTSDDSLSYEKTSKARLIPVNSMNFGSSHQRCSLREGVLRNFTKFTGKHLCQSLFFYKVAGLRPATSFKKRLWHRFFLWILWNF